MRFHLRMLRASWRAFRCWFVSNRRHKWAVNAMRCSRCDLGFKEYLELMAWERRTVGIRLEEQ